MEPSLVALTAVSCSLAIEAPRAVAWLSAPTRQIDLLRRVPLFEHCSKKDLALIAGVADELGLPAGKVLIQEGDRGREFLVIVSGEVEVRRKGRKRGTLGAGNFVGEMALLSKQPRSATVTALTPLVVLVITDRHFIALLDRTPEL